VVHPQNDVFSRPANSLLYPACAAARQHRATRQLLRAAIEKSKEAAEHLFPWKRLGIAKVHEAGQGCPAAGQSYKEAVTVAHTAIPGGTLMAVQKLEKHEWRRRGHRHVTQTAPPKKRVRTQTL
jgi:hypothetical protein